MLTRELSCQKILLDLAAYVILDHLAEENKSLEDVAT